LSLHEQNIFQDILLEEMSKKGFSGTRSLSQASHVISVEVLPILKDQSFIYQAKIEVQDLLGSKDTFKGASPKLSQALKIVFDSIPECMPLMAKD
jgi:hypothetical protein